MCVGMLLLRWKPKESWASELDFKEHHIALRWSLKDAERGVMRL